MNENLMHDPARADQLILVDGLDRQVGTAYKEDAHVQGLLHRAFSVVMVRTGERGTELLLSQRAAGKYHSAGLWANSCCSHPRAGEEVREAALRRVREELGCDVVDPQEIDAFVYRAEFGNGLAEYEYDHVLVGGIAGEPTPDPSEVSAVRWIAASDLALELTEHPERFAAWAFTVLSLALRHIEQQ